MNRWMTLTAAILALLLARGATAQEKTTVTVWGLAITADDKGTDELVRAFEAKHPNIRLRLLGMGAGSMNPQKLMTAIVGGVPPDIVKQDRFTISDWASRNAFRSLDDLIARDRATDPYCPTPEQYYPTVWEEASYEGKVYALPEACDDRILYWNRSVFKEKADVLRKAGLDPERAPKNWSELLAYSKALTEFNKDGTIKRAGFLPNWGNSWLYMYAFMMNGQFISDDGRKCTLANKENVEALQFMKDGYDILGGYATAEKFQNTFLGEANNAFLVGQVAMVINGDWELYNYSKYKPDLDFGTVPAPSPDARVARTGVFKDEKDPYITWAGGFSYAIPRGAKHVDEAWEFIKYMSSKEGRLLMMNAQQKLEQSRGRRYIPRIQAHIETNTEAIKLFASGTSDYDAALKEHVEMMKYARIRPATFAGQVLWDEHVRAAERAMRGFDTPKVALENGQVSVQRILDEVYDAEKYPEINLQLPLWIGFGAVVFSAFLGWYLVRRKGLGKLARNEARWGYILISPWIIGFLVFTLGPMVASLFFSFTQYNVLTEARWVGGKNYADLFQGDLPLLMKAFVNVLFLAITGVPIGLVVGLGIALLLNQDIKGMRFYRTSYYLPAIVPGVVTVVLWMFILNSDPARGMVNQMWQGTISQWLAMTPPGWLTDDAWAKPSLVLMGLWGAGSGMILWLAGLKGVPRTLYEAASIDGANPKQQFWQITIPQLSPLIFFSVIMGFIGAVQTFDSIFIITKGEGAGPNDTLLVPVYHLFVNGFKYFRMGYASALAWLIFAIILGITLVQFKLAKRWVHYEVER
jgi:multiple sugar transport system permease protein